MNNMRINKISAGNYEVTDPNGDIWTVFKYENGYGMNGMWGAAMLSDRNSYFDPTPTMKIVLHGIMENYKYYLTHDENGNSK